MTERTNLRTQYQIWKAKAEVWEQAFTKLLNKQNISSLPELIEEETIEQQYQEGEQYALKSIVELHKDENQEEFQVKGIWWDMALNFLREKTISFIVGALKGLIKDQVPNLIKLADWLMEQLEEKIIKGYNQLDGEYQGLIKNELKQYPQFSRLLKKLE